MKEEMEEDSIFCARFIKKTAAKQLIYSPFKELLSQSCNSLLVLVTLFYCILNSTQFKLNPPPLILSRMV